MAKYVPDGSVHIKRYRKVKTFGDFVKDIAKGIVTLAVIAVVLAVIFG